MIELAKRLKRPDVAAWISENEDDYVDGVFRGFVTESRLEIEKERKKRQLEHLNVDQVREIHRKSENNGSKIGKSLIKNALLTHRFIHREQLIGILIQEKVSKSFPSARRYLNRILTMLRKEGYNITKNKNYYTVQGVSKKILAECQSQVEPQTQAEQPPAKKENEEMARRKNTKKQAAKAKTSKAKAKKGNGKAKAKSDKKSGPTIGEFVTQKLTSGEHTKRQLAQAIIKAGLTQSTEENAVIKYLNVMFYKMKKRGVNLKRKDKSKDGGGTVGFYRITSK
jgi:hypothetical protein